MSLAPRPRLPYPTLCLVTDLGLVKGDRDLLAERVSSAVDGGANLVQIRAPEMDADEYGQLIAEMVFVVSGRALILVNPSSRPLSRYDGVNGVQLGENAAVTVAEARRMYGGGALIGRSVHSLAAASVAAKTGADFVVLGTIFASSTHPGGETQGPGIVRTVVDETGLDVIGIGGISSKNVGEVIANGARGVAVIRSVLGADDPAVAARELMTAMLRAR